MLRLWNFTFVTKGQIPVLLVQWVPSWKATTRFISHWNIFFVYRPPSGMPLAGQLAQGHLIWHPCHLVWYSTDPDGPHKFCKPVLGPPWPNLTRIFRKNMVVPQSSFQSNSCDIVKLTFWLSVPRWNSYGAGKTFVTVEQKLHCGRVAERWVYMFQLVWLCFCCVCLQSQHKFRT